MSDSSGELQIELLGPVEARVDGRPVALGGQRPRALFAVLALMGGRVVTSDQLVDELWGEKPPARARDSLRMHVSRLRKAFTEAGAGADRIVSQAGGYLLDVQPGERDVDRWQQILGRARRAHAAGNPQLAREEVEEALRVWRGQPLAGVSTNTLLAAERARLEEERLGAIIEGVALDLEMGHHGELLGQLEALVIAHPFQERLVELQMLALYRAGRPADALAAFDAARGRFVNELGIEPAQPLRELHENVLKHSAELSSRVELPAGTVTMLFTDVEGSTRLLRTLGADHYRAQLDLHHELLRAAFTSHGGVEVDTQGDAFFVAFPTATGAIAAAAEGQHALFGAHWPHGHPMRVRMGLHTGEPTLADRAYVGLDVHLAARIMASGHGGQVLVSQSTARLAADAQAQLRDLGEHRLKDIADPQRLYQVVVPGLSADFPPIKSLDNRPTNLPVELTPLIGRRRQRTDLQALLERDDVRLLTLTGAGGVGKTRLSLSAAADWREGHAGWTFVVELAPIVDAGLVATTVVETLGLQRAPEESATSVLRRQLADQAALLVLDNFEHVLEAGPWCSELLAACPSLRLLVTSRAPLRVSVEHEYPVPPLDFPADAGLAANEAAETEAVELFAERARRVRHGFVLDAETVPVVAEICRRLDGLPLAIELAAARARLLSPRAMLARLQQPLALLESGARDLPARQRTMRATIGWSFQLLPAEGQRALADLAIFQGGCTLDAAEAVAHATLDLLEGLVDANLLRVEDDRHGEPRFGMPQTIGQFALEALTARDEADVVAARHAQFFADLVRRNAGEPYTADVRAGLVLLEVEHDNLRGALRWATGGGDPALGVELAGRLTEFWDVRGHVAEGREWLEAAIQLGDVAAHADLARALLGSARLALVQDDHAAARKPAQESLELYRKLDDPSGIVRSLPHLAWVHDLAGEPDESFRLVEEAVALAHQRGVSAWELGRALNFLAMHLLGFGDLDRAREVEGQSLALRRQLGDTRGTVISLSNLSEIALAHADVESASALSSECFSLSRDLGYSEILAVSAIQLGVVSLVRDDLAQAAEHLRTALKEVRQHRVGQVVADALKATSVLAAQRDNPQDAIRLWACGTRMAAYAPPYDAVLTRLSSTLAPLPSAERAHAEAAGRLLSDEEAIELALAVCCAAGGT